MDDENGPVGDKHILRRIHDLVAEEHNLRAQVQNGTLDSDREHVRLRELEVSLDQCWDLLRQRRATRDAGGDDTAAKPRPIGEVEEYLQ